MKSRSLRRASLAAGAALVLGALSPVLSAPAASAAEPTISVSSNEVLDLGFDGALTDATTKHTVSMQTGTASYVAGADGVANHAIDFTGSSALNLGTAADLQPQDLTLSFWYKPDADMGSGEQVFAWSKTVYNSDGWYLSSLSSTTPLLLSVGPSSSQPYTVQVNGTRSAFFPTGQWTHVMVTYDHTTRAVTFYRNGVKQTATTVSNTSASGILGSESTSTKTIGYNGPTYKASFIHGAMDDYRLYDGVATDADATTLTDEHIAALQNADLATLSLPSIATNDLTLPAGAGQPADRSLGRCADGAGAVDHAGPGQSAMPCRSAPGAGQSAGALCGAGPDADGGGGDGILSRRPPARRPRRAAAADFAGDRIARPVAPAL